MRLGSLLILAAVLFCSLSAAAQAATVTGERVRVEEDGIVYHVLEVHYEAVAGEANDLMVTITGEEVSFDDAGAPIDAQGECTNTDSDSAVCSSSDTSLSIPSILLGDVGDEARIASESARLFRVRGGPGDDRLHGGESGDYLFAGPGDDQLYGADGTDRLFAGPGDDFVDGGPGGDTINGGGGRDELRAGELANDFQTDSIKDGDRDRSADNDKIFGHPDRTYVTYRARRDRVMVDLAAGVAGAKGERDQLVGITQIETGRGNDYVAGSQAGEFIRGNSGADEIRALGGDDLIAGESGADRLYGGRGDDVANDFDTDNATDVHSCGRGHDFVGLTDKRDRLRHACEDGAWTPLPDSPPNLNRITSDPLWIGRKAVFRSTCHDHPKCTGRIVLKAAGQRLVLGRGSFEFRRFRGNNLDRAPRHDVVAHLNERGRAWLADGGFVRVVIVSRPDCMGCLNPSPPARTGYTTWMKR